MGITGTNGAEIGEHDGLEWIFKDLFCFSHQSTIGLAQSLLVHSLNKMVREHQRAKRHKGGWCGPVEVGLGVWGDFIGEGILLSDDMSRLLWFRFLNKIVDVI